MSMLKTIKSSLADVVQRRRVMVPASLARVAVCTRSRERERKPTSPSSLRGSVIDGELLPSFDGPQGSLGSCAQELECYSSICRGTGLG